MNNWHNPYYEAPTQLQPQIHLLTAEMERRSTYWAKWPERSGVELTVFRWAGAVERLMLSDKHMSDEYLHDLDKRRNLHRLMTVAHELELAELLAWMIPIVDKTDDRFREISAPDTDELMRHKQATVPEYWWYRRITTNPFTLNQFREIEAAYQAKRATEND